MILLKNILCGIQIFQKFKKVLLIVVLLLISTHAFGQITINGSISDSDGPLPGASVVVQGSNVGVTTDFDGNFSIEANQGEILELSYVGFKTQLIKVDSSDNNISITLESDNQLDEIIVTGYGAERRSQITGAVASISPAEMNKNTASTLDNALQGKVAGVSVSANNSTPGGGISVRIRGVGGIGNSEPLYVIDGMPITVSGNENSSPLSSINPQDIESISILKDAASAAIYGSRAANGVVLINTKTGKRNQKSEVAVSAKYGVQSAANSYSMMDAQSFADYRNLLETNAGRPAIFTNTASLGKGTNWFDAITRSAEISDLQASFTGGSETGSYFLSLGHFKQEGIVKSSSFERISLRLNADKRISDKFKIGSNIVVSRTKQDVLWGNNRAINSAIAQSVLFYPTIPVYDNNGNFSPTPANGFYKPKVNPLFQLNIPAYPPIVNSIRANVYAEYKIMPDLVFKTSAFYTDSNTSRKEFGSMYDLGVAVSTEQTILKQQSQSYNALIENTLNYRLNIDNHSLSMLLGQSAQSIEQESLLVSGDYFEMGNNTIDELANALNVTNVINEESYMSFFSKLNYVFDGKYLMTAIVRRDGSSKFGSNKRWGTFPSVSLGWNVSEEDFIPTDGAMNSLRLRGGWGQVGNDRIDNYLSTVVVSSGYNYAFGNVHGAVSPGLGLGGIPNPDIQWETVTQYSIGVDAAFFDNRLNFTAEYYNKTQNDMLIPVPQSGVTGLAMGMSPGEIVLNTGDLTNSGLEFSVNYSGEAGKISYNFGANLTTLNNKINDLTSPINRYSLNGSFVTRTVEGGSLGEFYGHVADGLFQSAAEVSSHAKQNDRTSPGDIRFKDLNDDDIINDADKTSIGSPIPDFIYGFNMSLDYDNFDFSIQGNGVHGNEIFNASNNRLLDNADSLNKLDFTPWSASNTNTRFPRAVSDDPNNNLRHSSFFVEDGSFMRIKVIQLGYSFQEDLASKIGAKRIRLYSSIQNPFTFTSYSGLDPEVGNDGGNNMSSGIDNFVYPVSRIFSVGLNVQL
tara:strand:- start:1695 stop:4769 length:3075 start_codon:yes stop_codon:yes gene_type:complete